MTVFPVRLVHAYGTQEYDSKLRKDSCWRYHIDEAQNAESKGTGYIVEKDGTFVSRFKIIKDDPEKQNLNRKLFQEFLVKNPNLTC